MVFRVDLERLRLRSKVVRKWEGMSGNELWVRIDGLSHLESFKAVRAAVSGFNYCSVYATVGGTLVVLPTRWKDIMHALVDELESAGLSGAVTVSPVATQGSVHPVDVAAGMLLWHQVDPWFWEAPPSDTGRPEPMWAVTQDASSQLMDGVLRWVLEPESPAFVQDHFYRVPVGPENAREVLSRIWPPPRDHFVHHVALGSIDSASRLVRRYVGLGQWGQSVWFDAEEPDDPVERALRLATVLVDAAPGLRAGFIQPETNYFESGGFRLGACGGLPELWDQYVPDPFGIQLVTGAHLRKAHDLSRWNVKEVASDRYLITASDLTGWFDAPAPGSKTLTPFPDPILLDHARADFGDMIMPDAVRREATLRRRQRPSTPPPS